LVVFVVNGMNVRKVNLGLWTLTAGLAAGAVVCAGLGVFTPVEVDAERDGLGRRTAAASQGSTESKLSFADFESIWRLNLRKSLIDAPASAPMADVSKTPVAAATATGGPFMLIGTIGDSLAMIRTASGAVELKGLGEMVNGVKIVAIRPAQVDVESDGQRMTVAKLREGSGG
jgi:hypothetical protein